MKFSFTFSNLTQATPRATPEVIALSAAAILLISFAVGCASPAPPHAPSLKLPEIVKDLAAERVGTEVRLHWTTPEKTTDHLLIENSITAEICRISNPIASPAAKSPACTPVKRIPIHTGPSQATDILPASLTADPASLLAYRVQLFNTKGHSAGLSAEVFVAAGAAPAPVEKLRASAIRDGAMIEWQKKDTTASVELDRHLVGPDGADVEPTSHKEASPQSEKSPQKGKDKTKANTSSTATPASQPKPFNLAPPAPVEIKLQTPKEISDTGGTVDHTVQKNQTYHYTAQRIRFVSIDGHTLGLRSAASAPITLTMRDIFPPRAPTGLEAVPGGVTPSDVSIDLSWTPNTETDLAGYIVYRQEINSAGVVAGTVARLNQTPVVGPAYRDQTAVIGHRYAYRVTAVDTVGNESPPSEEVQEALRPQL